MSSASTSPTLIVKCLPITQPIGTFYVGVINADDLVDITWTDARRIADSRNDEDSTSGVGFELGASFDHEEAIEDIDSLYLDPGQQDFEEFLGIQRRLNDDRIKEIRQYVKTRDATFPSSVLVAVSSEDAQFDEKESVLIIRRHDKAAKIIDGQHRIKGLECYEGPRFDVNVSIFVDMDIQDQAMVFATINLTQTKVNRSLAYDLYAFTKSRSPQRTAHDIVRFLNYREGSPFFRKIKMLGTGSREETITQATFVDRLLRYITRDPMGDRDVLRRGRRLRTRGYDPQSLIFRNWFVNEDDVKIAVVLWNYFSAVESRWPKAWNEVFRGNMLNRTNGFRALMRFLRIAYNSRGASGHAVSIDEFKSIFAAIALEDDDFNPTEFVPGSSGERRLFERLVEQSGLR